MKFRQNQAKLRSIQILLFSPMKMWFKTASCTKKL